MADPDFIPLNNDPDFIPLGAVPGNKPGIIPGKDPFAGLKPYDEAETRRGALKAGATAAGRLVAQGLDMINLFPTALGAISYVGNKQIIEPEFNPSATPRERSRAATDRANRVREAVGAGVFEKWYNELVSQDENVVNEVMGKLDEGLTSIGRDYESRTGGKVTAEDFKEMFNVATLGIPAKLGQRKLFERRKRTAAGEEFKLNERAPAEAPPLTEEARILQEAEAARDAAAPLRKDFAERDAARNALATAQRLMQEGADSAKVRKEFARAKAANEPLGQALDIIHARRAAAAEAFRDSSDSPIREDGTFAPGALSALLREGAPVGSKEFAARDAAAGIRRGPLGEPIEVPLTSSRGRRTRGDRPPTRPADAESRGGVDSAGIPVPPKVVRGPLGEPIEVPWKIDQKLAIALGAGGAAALLYSDWDALGADEAGMLIGVGAISALPAKTPLGPLLHAADGTLKTLERLPPKKFEFSLQEIQQQLKRQDVPANERIAFEKVLAERGKEGKITARELVEGLSTETEFAKLVPKETQQYAAYGLQDIGRATVSTEHAEMYGLTAADVSTPQVRTTIYASPFELGDANHFQDPNYFAHARSFDEGGVRHVVEIQSDLAQKAGKQLTVEEKAELEARMRWADEAETVWARVQFTAGRAGEYDFFAGLDAFKRNEAKLTKALGHGDQTLMLENKLLTNMMNAGPEMVRLADEFALEKIKDFPPEKMADYERGHIDISDGIIDYLLAKRKEIDPADAEVMRGALVRYAGAKADEFFARLDEARSKLKAQDIDPVRPMLKDWWKRVVNEEIGQADAARRERLTSDAQLETDIAEAQRKAAAEAKSADWVQGKEKQIENHVYDLGVLAMDLRNGHVSEGTARQYMLRIESELPPPARKRWQEYYESAADETEGFLRPDEAGTWGNDYAANFPEVMRKFLSQELGIERSWTAHLQYLISQRGMWKGKVEPTPKTIRFATADTVAKVEGWPRTMTYREGAEVQSSDVAGMRRVGNIKDSNGNKHFGDFPLTGKLRVRNGVVEAELQNARTGEIIWAPEGTVRFSPESETARALGQEAKLSPEHQSIYDRYRRDIEKYLRTLGGKEVVDAESVSWIEVPLPKPDDTRVPLFGGRDPAKPGPLGKQAGAIDPQLARALTTLGIGAAAGAALSDPDDKLYGALKGAIAIGAARFALSRSPDLAKVGKEIGQNLERFAGLWSNSVRQLSEPILRRVRLLEMEGLRGTYNSIDRISGFVNDFLKAPDDFRQQAAKLLFDGNEAAVIAALPKSLGESYKVVRQELTRLGEEMKKYGLISDLLPGYFPRIVKDYDGLRTAIGAPLADRIDTKIAEAERKSQRLAGRPLSDIEKSAIINKELASGYRGVGKPGFTKQRKLDSVPEELLPFYEAPEVSLTRYVQNATWAIERAKFFGKSLQKDAEGRIDVDNSIGNFVLAERKAGRLTADEGAQLQKLLEDRFVGGEQAGSHWLQTLRTGVSISLIGNFASAATQIGDIAMSLALHGPLTTVRAIDAVLRKGPEKITAREYGLVNHMAEELVSAGKTARLADFVFKYSGFRMTDLFGKDVFLTAAGMRVRRMSKTRAGVEELRRKYGDYFGERDFTQLIADLQNSNRSVLADELLFAELTRTQPIARSEMPAAWLANPNSRLLWTMSSWMLKQLDLMRTEAWQAFQKGDRMKGVEMGLRIGVGLYLSNVTGEAARNWILQREAPEKSTRDLLADVPYNLLKTFGLNDYFFEAFQRGKGGEAMAGLLSPPLTPVSDAINFAVDGNPKIVRNIPLIGRHIENFGTDELRTIPGIGDLLSSTVVAAVGPVPSGREAWAKAEEKRIAAREKRNDPIAQEERKFQLQLKREGLK